MKKIALVLAVVLALTACLFALSACGDEEETSSAAESKAESAAESKAESKEESKAESKEESKEESSAVAESSEEPAESSEESQEPVEPSEENLALDKPYTTSQLMRQGGPDAGWGWDANAEIAYPDEEGTSLTNGVVPAGDEGFEDSVWAGFNKGCPDYETNGGALITVDLGVETDVCQFIVNAGSKLLGNGIVAPTGVEILVSNDGETFTSLCSATFTDSEEVNNVSATAEKAATARYVQFRITGTGWMFISEVEIH